MEAILACGDPWITETGSTLGGNLMGAFFSQGGPFCFGLWQMFAWFIVVFLIFCAYFVHIFGLENSKGPWTWGSSNNLCATAACSASLGDWLCVLGWLQCCHGLLSPILLRWVRSYKPPSHCFLFELSGRSTDIWHQEEGFQSTTKSCLLQQWFLQVLYINLSICSHFLLMTLLLLCYLQWTNWPPTWHTLLGTETLRFHESCLKL